MSRFIKPPDIPLELLPPVPAKMLAVWQALRDAVCEW